MHDALLRDRHVTEAARIDEEVLRHDREGLDRAAHGEEPGPVDVDAVDLLRFDEGNRPGDGRLPDDRSEARALLGRKLLRIVDARHPAAGREDDRRGGYRPGERAHPRFVDPGYAGEAR